MVEKRLFLERRGYRMRRLLDAVRLLPILGLFLCMLPLLWPVADPQEGGNVATSAALRYIFAIWMGLSVASWLLWRKTRDVATGDGEMSLADPSLQEPE
jgi:hypothetical protein